MWTLQKMGDPTTNPESSFANLGLYAATLALHSQGLDKFGFTIAHDIDEPLPYVFGDVLIIRRERDETYGIPGNIRTLEYTGGSIAFIGLVDMPPRRASGNAEELSYELTGPWWYLDNLVYQQPWYIVTDTAHPLDSRLGGYQSHILMNNGINGARLFTDWQIWDAVHFAIGFQTVNKKEIRLGYPTDAKGAPMLVPTTQHYTIKNPAGDPPTVDIGAGPDATAKFPSIEVPYSEGRDMTCGEVIRRQLKWSPDALTWFDYTTTHPVTGVPMPTFNCVRRADMKKMTLDLTDVSKITTRIELTRRDELKVPAVVVKFERTNTVDDVAYRLVDIRVAPNPDGFAVGSVPYLALADNYQRLFAALNITMDLEGSVTSTTSATIVTQRIDAMSPNPVVQLNWWKSKLKWLNDPRIRFGVPLPGDPPTMPFPLQPDNPFGIFPGSTVRQVEPVPNDDGSLPPFTPITDPTLVNEIIEGQIPPWLLVKHVTEGNAVSYQPAQAVREIISAQLRYQLWEPNPLNGLYDGGATLKDQPNVSIEHHSTSTDAAGGTYNTELTTTLSETIPEQLAQQLYDATSVLQFSGQVAFVEEECSGAYLDDTPEKKKQSLHPGVLLNITNGGDPMWKTMDAMIQGVTEDIDTGTTQLVLGFATHLGPDDLIELLRINRLRVTNTSPAARLLGLSQQQANKVTLGQKNADRNGLPALTEFQKMLLLMPNGQFVNVDAINKVVEVQDPPPAAPSTAKPNKSQIAPDRIVIQGKVATTTQLGIDEPPTTVAPGQFVVDINGADILGGYAKFRLVHLCVDDGTGNFVPGYIAFVLMTDPVAG
jgi:hypothetical protein